MNRAAVISEDGRYRYSLTREWGSTGGCVVWLMLNPSRADDKRDDPTLKRCIHFSQRWGYGELIVINHYPLISSKPRDLAMWWQSYPSIDCAERDNAMRRNVLNSISAIVRADLLMAAWGSSYPKPIWTGSESFRTLLEMVPACDRPPVGCLGQTRDGDPKHPMARGRSRVPDDFFWQAYPWRTRAAKQSTQTLGATTP